MERSPLTDTRTTVIAPAIDVTQRLQDVISKWRTLPEGYSLDQLYKDCSDIVGSDKHLLPLKIIPVKDLDATTLTHAMRRRGIAITFRVTPIGRFESALIPDSAQQNFYLALEEALQPADQVALFGHAVAHLIKNHQDREADQENLTLDPKNDRVHIDKLNELRYFDMAQSGDKINRDVLKACPRLQQLFETPEESPAVQTQVRLSLEGMLRCKKWAVHNGLLVRMQYRYTDGRVLPDPSGQTRRGKQQSIDALLRIETSLPTAIIHRQRPDESEAIALRRVREAGQQLAVPFGYVVTEQRDILEYDWTQGPDADFTLRAELPDRAELEKRWFEALQISDAKGLKALTYPFYMQDKQPRYYQEAAINKAIIATLQAQRGMRHKRILLTLATGTGKTQVAFQILWKLKQTRAVRNIMFIADRSYLLDQAQYNAFGPFGDALARGMGEIDIVHDIIFASYQWLANNSANTDQPNYLGYPSDYFDVIVIDECHRGSADENSNWRKVLTHFSEAVQIGLTATPLATKDVQTKNYFGDAIYTYSLSQGINDGYLAPYRVRRIQIGQNSRGGACPRPNLEQQEIFVPALPETPAQNGKPQEEIAQEIVMETAQAMRTYTKAIAEHLASYLRQTDPQAKTIIFCVDNEHANQMRIALRAACADFVRPDDIVRIVDDDGTEGKLSLSNFCAPKNRQPVIVTTARLLSTGIDVPTCKNIVLARGVGSIVEFKQIIGRGTRLYTSSTPPKNWFTILDYAGAIKHFFDRDFDGDPEYIRREDLIANAPVGAELASARTSPSPTISSQTNDTNINRENDITPDVRAEGNTSDVRVNDNTPEVLANDNIPEVLVNDNIPEVLVNDNTSDILANDNTPEVLAETSSAPTDDLFTSYDNKTNDFSSSNDKILSNNTNNNNKAQPVGAELASARTSPLPTISLSQTTSPQTNDTNINQAQDHIPEVRAETSSAPTHPGSSRTIKEGNTPSEPELTLEEAEKQGKVRTIQQKSNGKEYKIVGETIYELGPDGHTLRQGSARDFAEQALRDFITSPDVLRQYWLTKEGRRDIIAQLESELVTPEALAAALNRTDVDTLDLLLYVVFQIEPLTRAQRVERLRQQHQDFFQRYATPPLAARVLDAILEKYSQGDAIDVSDTRLLYVPPLTTLGNLMELAKAFKEGPEKKTVASVLQEMHRLLYSV